MKTENFEKLFKSKSAGEFVQILEEGCTRCSLHKHGCKPIVYKGNIKAPILLLGESPGLVEERERKPFVGPAGQLQHKIFESIGLDCEEDICWSNVTYCRPTAPENSGKQNYTPKNEQLEQCFLFVEKFIKLINPKIIIACGRTALQQLTGDKNIKMGTWEGKWLKYKQISMFIQTHPAAILHIPKESDRNIKKAQVWGYMQYFRDTWKEQIKDGHSI